jgi:hypothetical protein
LPPAPTNATELSDEDLEKVAGGTEVLVVMSVAMAAAVSFAGAVGSVAGTAALTKSNGW